MTHKSVVSISTNHQKRNNVMTKPLLVSHPNKDNKLPDGAKEYLADDSPLWMRLTTEGGMMLTLQGYDRFYTLMLPPHCVEALRMTLTNT